jgi:hypothetical protein
VGWVGRRFILLGKFIATLPSSTPAHSPIVVCTARCLSILMAAFSSAAMNRQTKSRHPLLVRPTRHRLLAYQKSLELLAAVRSAQIRDAKFRDEALRAAKGSCVGSVAQIISFCFDGT